MPVQVICKFCTYIIIFPSVLIIVTPFQSHQLSSTVLCHSFLFFLTEKYKTSAFGSVYFHIIS